MINNDALGGIEATLMAVNGMAEVFNATYHAIYNSLETIFNVLEELTRLKTKIRHMVPLLALWNWLRYIWRFLLSCLKLRKKNSDDMEVVWMGFRNISKISQTRVLVEQRHSLHNASSVKFRLFSSLIVWLIALGVPYLVYQLLTEMKFQVSESIKWKSQRDQYYEAVASFFKNSLFKFCNLSYGDTLYIAPKEYQPRKPGYILACIKDGSKIGLVPIKKVRLIKHVSGIPLVFNKRCDTEFRRSVHDSEKHLSD
ncbi:unnamed protein product [Thelazia callipaeda]|uniref:Peroxin-13 n=1 Tax=Thelazia callipaeda TaxID=103827 RepID=A0A0N5CV93_THECL|nr:unnamed protein product [Thelazia callipaeda]